MVRFRERIDPAQPCRQHRRRPVARDPLPPTTHSQRVSLRSSSPQALLGFVSRLAVGIEGPDDILADLDLKGSRPPRLCECGGRPVSVIVDPAATAFDLDLAFPPRRVGSLAVRIGDLTFDSGVGSAARSHSRSGARPTRPVTT